MKKLYLNIGNPHVFHRIIDVVDQNPYDESDQQCGDFQSEIIQDMRSVLVILHPDPFPSGTAESPYDRPCPCPEASQALPEAHPD